MATQVVSGDTTPAQCQAGDTRARSRRLGGSVPHVPLTTATLPSPHRPPGRDTILTPGDVRRVVKTGRLTLAYQPIVDLAQGLVAGYECLARFPGPPYAAPDAWLRAAAPLGLSHQLERAAFELALSRRAELPPDTFLSINISPDFALSDELKTLLTQVEDLQRVVVEITEHVPVLDAERLQASLSLLRDLGALIAMDDAGTGYAGLLQLLSLRPQIVKLDRELVRDISVDPARSALAELLGELVGRLDAWLLAEGIETTDELEACLRLGIPLGQGRLLGAPAPTFATIPPELRGRILSRQLSNSRSTVGSLIEGAGSASSLDEARWRADATAAGAVVLLDEHDRPVRIVSSAGVLAVPLVVSPDTPVDEAACRAMTRDSESRFLPLVCTDGRGRLLGLVRVESLVGRLVDLARAPWVAVPHTEEDTVKQFRCGDVVPGCLGVFEATDEQGILSAVAAHARDDHGMTEVPPELVDQVRARIVDVRVGG